MINAYETISWKDILPRISFFLRYRKYAPLWSYRVDELKENFFSLLEYVMNLFSAIFSLMNPLDIFAVGSLFFCIIVTICILSGYKKRIIKIEKENIPILIPLISMSISYFIFRLGNLSHTNSDSARYVLSALVQSEAAIIAIVISLSLVAVQLTASSYSPRVTKIFRNSRGLWILVCSYIFAMLYTLCVLKMVESTLELRMETYIVLCYFVGIFCLTALIPYTWNMFTMLRASKIIKILSQKITKDNFNGEDPIQPIMDLVRGSIMRSDYETAGDGLVEIREKICSIFEEGKSIGEKEKEISKTVCGYFSTIGKLSVNNGNGDLALKVVLNIEKMGEIAIEKGLKKTLLEMATSLGEVGVAAVEKECDEVVFEVAFYLGEIGETAVEKGYEKVAGEVVFSLGEVGVAAVKKLLTEETFEVISILRRIGETAVEKGYEKVGWEVISILRRIGETAVEKGYEKVAGEVVFSLGEVGVAAVEKGYDETFEVVSILRRIGETAVEKGYEKVAGEVVSLLKRIGETAVEKGYDEIAFETTFYLGEVGTTAVDKGHEKVAFEVVVSLRMVGTTAVEKGLGKIVRLVVSSLGEVGMASMEEDRERIVHVVRLVVSSLGEVGVASMEEGLTGEAWEVVLILREVRAAAVEVDLREEALKIVSILEKIAKTARRKKYKNLALEIEQYLSEIDYLFFVDSPIS